MTKTCTKAITTWTTVNKPTSTVLVTQYKLTTSVQYDTKTVDTLQTTTARDTAVSTDISVTSVVTTITQSATSTATETITATATSTSIQNIQADPCANPVLYQAIRPFYPAATVGVLSDSYSPQDCCQRCFGTNAGCLYWRYSNQACYLYVIPNAVAASSCITSSCRKGRPALVPAPGDGSTYGIGICAQSDIDG
ncbi:hypothetical protein P153DRAFT_400718 [Dothidotthia symphoricarpi CBS 119687]|uniref:Apple domain-containing protein n=1 Tax=Dothidotthia symphoricarpi CBS 119687 TaxID=1392245 RepID=A0A6A6A0X9_9PLEO|nr:uncharacterized protein P153DRAFT_400718 [Dothidotthia symphoricarpi CBS 119687]KAF2124617.1 hypothetical protein P153DRAFT_400718 [Dothidotthia symphoricarpi CBS 119687]